MKYFSLFTGIGGFELGIMQAYEQKRTSTLHGTGHRAGDNKQRGKGVGKTAVYFGDQSAARGPVLTNRRRTAGKPLIDAGPICIGYSEIDKYATQIYQSHFPTHKNYGDITKIKEKELPDFDFLCGGFPCQSFSIAGQRRGFSDTRGTLFFDICRIIKEKQPRLILLENVKGLLSHDEGRTFAVIIAALDDLGYDLQWQVLNSKDFGVPQNRERVFIVGHLRGTRRPEVFPFADDAGVSAETGPAEKAQSQTKSASTIRTKQGTRVDDNFVVGTLRTHKDGEGFRRMQSCISPTLNGRARADGSQQTIIIDGKSRGSKTRRGIVKHGYTGALEAGSQFMVEGIRRLTPIECERLQGFPDNWTAGVSDTQRYKVCGNAVTTNVIQAIMERLI